MKRFYLLIVTAVLFAAVAPIHAATKLSVNSIGDLEVASQDGKTARAIVSGTIGEIITADSQTFKISYGKDLKGSRTLIVYPDPAKPQSLKVNFMGQDISLTSDAVLTVIASDNTALVKSGFLGSITVGDQKLVDGATAQIQNGAIVGTTPPVIASVPPTPPPAPESAPAPTEQPAPASTVVVADKTPEKPPEPEPVNAPQPDDSDAKARINIQNFSGPSAIAITGDVMVAPPGKNVIDLVNESSEPPRLKAHSSITPGCTVVTGPNSRAVICPFPGTLVGLEPGTTFTFDEIGYTPGAPVERKFSGNLAEGTVLSSIKGANPKTTDYKIKTSFGVAAARGTQFLVSFDGKKMVVKTHKGVVLVVDLVHNSVEIDVPGKKGVVIRKKSDGTYENTQLWPLSPEELAALQKLFAALEDNDDDNGHDHALREALENFQKVFNPRLNDLPITQVIPGG